MDRRYGLDLNPNPLDDFTIFHRDHVRFSRLIFLARARSNESARSAQRKAEQHYCDLRHEAHGLIPNSKAFGSFSRQPAPSGTSK